MVLGVFIEEDLVADVLGLAEGFHLGHHALDVVFAEEGALNAAGEGVFLATSLRSLGPQFVNAAHKLQAAGEQHVAAAEQLFGAHLVNAGRRRVAPYACRFDSRRICNGSLFLLATWKAMRLGKLALMRPVMTSTEGRWVASTRWMPGHGTCGALGPQFRRGRNCTGDFWDKRAEPRPTLWCHPFG